MPVRLGPIPESIAEGAVSELSFAKRKSGNNSPLMLTTRDDVPPVTSIPRPYIQVGIPGLAESVRKFQNVFVLPRQFDQAVGKRARGI